MKDTTCQNCKNDFVIEVDDSSFYEKIKSPPPTWCPECRLIRRLSFRNERYLSKRPCELCKKDGLSIYGPSVERKVYCPACWWSDDWDSSESGVDYDFSKPFFEQFRELQKRAPVQSLFVLHQTIINSDYNNLAGDLKECYMVFHADRNERCMYASGLKDSNDSMDGLMLQRTDLTYESTNIMKGYRNFYSVDCEECSEVWFSKNCMNCQDCIGCVDLRNQQYCIFNEQYTKEDYEAKKKELALDTYSGIKKCQSEARELWLRYPQKYMHSRLNQNATGDYVYNSKNTLASFEMLGAEDCKYCQFDSTKVSKDCYDYTEYGDNVELAYEALLVGGNCREIRFSTQCVSSVNDVEYCYGVASSSHLFGCIGLHNKEYCIMNKQYTKEEYEELVPKIRQHMMDMPYVDAHGRTYAYGEFFPLDLASFGYNESTAQEFFPENPETAEQKGYIWTDVGEKAYVPTKKWNELPETFLDTPEDITKEIILCEAWDMDKETAKLHNCTKAFRILPQEFLFYQRMNLPMPRKCPNSRHYDRTLDRNPIKLWHRMCMCTIDHPQHTGNCPNEFETSYAPDRSEIVYCEGCYQAEVM